MARFEWYEGIGIPMFIVDGILSAMGGNTEGSEIDRYLPLVENRLIKASPLFLTAGYSVAAGQASLTADVTADVMHGPTELDFSLSFFVCQQGLGGQSNMVVDMLPSEPFLFTETGQTATVQREFALDPAWTLDSLRLVVIAQDLETKEVLQAALAAAQAPTGTPIEDGAAVLAHRAWPNPFGPSTTIGFSLPRAGQTSLEVFDLDGRLVRTLVRAPLEAGEHQAVWRGDDQAGARLAAGTYFYRLRFAGEPARTGRMVLLR